MRSQKGTDYFIFLITLLLFNYSCLHFLHPHSPLPSPASTLPLGFVHVFFILVPENPSPHYQNNLFLFQNQHTLVFPPTSLLFLFSTAWWSPFLHLAIKVRRSSHLSYSHSSLFTLSSPCMIHPTLWASAALIKQWHKHSYSQLYIQLPTSVELFQLFQFEISTFNSISQSTKPNRGS